MTRRETARFADGTEQILDAGCRGRVPVASGSAEPSVLAVPVRGKPGAVARRHDVAAEPRLQTVAEFARRGAESTLFTSVMALLPPVAGTAAPWRLACRIAAWRRMTGPVFYQN